jgi:hypothetical protein
LAPGARSQQSAPASIPSDIASLQKAVQERDRALAELTTQIQQADAVTKEERATLAEAKLKALSSYYVSQASNYQNGDRLREYQQRVLSWQVSAANWLLLVVVLVALSGIVFAGYELVATRRLIGSAKSVPRGDAEPGSGTTTIIIEPTKIHITTAVVGIVVLGLSLGFLYLFIKEVYALKVLGIAGNGATQLVTAFSESSSLTSTPKQ